VYTMSFMLCSWLSVTASNFMCLSDGTYQTDT